MKQTYLFRVWGVDTATGQPAPEFRRPWLRTASDVSHPEAHRLVVAEFKAEFPGLRWVVELADVTVRRAA